LSGLLFKKPVEFRMLDAGVRSMMIAGNNYLRKMRGVTSTPPRVSIAEMIWSWIGAFLGISAVAYLNYVVLDGSDLGLMLGSFGASAILVYGAIKSPLAQPRNLIGGHVISGFVGVASHQLFEPCLWAAAAIAVATALALMHLTKTLHPPGGATALIAVIGGEKVHTLGFLYPIIPAGLGALIMLAVALLVNNIPKTRKYPEFWI
jgi:CBS-domain-containing membrane protein